MNEDTYAFWPYDLFPYVCSGVITGEIKMKNGVATAYSPAYRGNVRVLHTEVGSHAVSIKQTLEGLCAMRDAKIKEVEDMFLRDALAIAPFLADFPAYKDK